ncbi:MAG: GNAT family N-acetyltransferase [Erysipelotrichaceae bacterium]|nr:GNAT family N-acetyltransferase [Erysipelotrichaceae bacterium]
MIRRAQIKDIEQINELLSDVLEIHHKGRSDLFKSDTKKYTDEQLIEIIGDDSRPIFVYDENGEILGYAFCVFQQHLNDNILTDVKTLYIDDLVVREDQRGKHLGRQLYEHVVRFARESDCYNITLNVWAFNENARKFYEALGMKPQKIFMEEILDKEEA